MEKEKILAYLVPLVSVFLSYLLGRLQASATLDVEAKKARYEKVYVPYISLLYISRADCYRYSELPLETREKFFELLINNLHYLGPSTQNRMPDFYSARLQMLEQNEGEELLDKIFFLISKDVLSESSKLSRLLHLPRLGAMFSLADCSGVMRG